jgi:hypothetical protein
MKALKELVDFLEKHKVASLDVLANGSGDEGQIEDPDYEMVNEGDELPDVGDLIEAAFEEKGFDYYNNEGGSLHLNINVAERTCSWSAYQLREVECEDASNEEIV